LRVGWLANGMGGGKWPRARGLAVVRLDSARDVYAAGICTNGVIVTFGDGGSQEQAGELPLVYPTKTYAQSGSYTVSAAKKPGTFGCNASASANMSVKKPSEILAKLCELIDCPGLIQEQVTTPLGEDHFAVMGRPIIKTAFHLPPQSGGIPGYTQRLVPGGKILGGASVSGICPGRYLLPGCPATIRFSSRSSNGTRPARARSARWAGSLSQ